MIRRERPDTWEHAATSSVVIIIRASLHPRLPLAAYLPQNDGSCSHRITRIRERVILYRMLPQRCRHCTDIMKPVVRAWLMSDLLSTHRLPRKKQTLNPDCAHQRTCI